MKTIIALLVFTKTTLSAVANPTFTIDPSHPAGKVSPTFFGLMTGKINHADFTSEIQPCSS
jgi:hypothetical protein